MRSLLEYCCKMGTEATVGINCCNKGNWGHCWDTCKNWNWSNCQNTLPQQCELRSLLAYNDLRSHYHINDHEYHCCLWYHCCICCSFWVRVMEVHSSFELWSSTSNLLMSQPMMWGEQHLENFSVLQRVHLSKLVPLFLNEVEKQIFPFK
jgi:hypothetical protein